MAQGLPWRHGQYCARWTLEFSVPTEVKGGGNEQVTTRDRLWVVARGLLEALFSCPCVGKRSGIDNSQQCPFSSAFGVE